MTTVGQMWWPYIGRKINSCNGSDLSLDIVHSLEYNTKKNIRPTMLYVDHVSTFMEAVVMLEMWWRT